MLFLKIIFGILICIPFVYFLFYLFKKFVNEVFKQGNGKSKSKGSRTR